VACASSADCPDAPAACFAYVCSGDGRCELEAARGACDDDDPRTVEDRCHQGLCRGRTADRNITCEDPRLAIAGEGLCVPELGGVVYPILYWSDWDGHTFHVLCGDTCRPDMTVDCGEVVCWGLTNQCVIVVH
jgi:hypothetical protein